MVVLAGQRPRKWFREKGSIIIATGSHCQKRATDIDIDSSPAGRAIRKASDRALYSIGYNGRQDSTMFVMGTRLMAYPVPVAVAALE